MADNDPIVQDVEIGGADAAGAALESVGDRGAAAMEKVGDAADKASASLAGAGNAASDLGSKAGPALDKVGAGAAHLARVEAAALSFGSSLRNTASSVGSFVARVGLIGSATLTAVVGVIALGRALARQGQVQNSGATSTRLLSQQVKASSELLTQQQVAAVQNEQAFKDLFTQLAQGKITSVEYGKEVIALQQKQRDEAEVQRRVTLIQEAATEQRLKDVQRLKQQTEAQQEFNAVANKFGPQLANSLIRLGNVANSVYRSFTQVFGPVVAGFVDKLTNLIQENRGAIVDFFRTVVDAIAPVLQQASDNADNFATTIKNVVTGTAAAFKEIIIPAVVTFMGILNDAAALINSVFGTNLNGVALLIIALLIKMSGAATLLFNVFTIGASAVRLLLAAFGPWGLVAAAVVAAIVLIIENWDKIVALAGTAAAAIQQKWQEFSDWFASTWVGKIIGAIKDAIVWFNNLGKAADKNTQQAVQDINNPELNLGLIKTEGLAGGGQVRGPGTSTSDSVLARLSRGEFVMRFAAVKKYGLGVMHAINQGMLALPKFNLGGLVDQISSPILIPAFADGGAPSGKVSTQGRPIILNFGTEQFTVFAQENDTANRLGRYATKRRMSQAGRKPSYYGAG